MSNRETIYKALYDTLIAALPTNPAPFVTKSRKLRSWDDVDAEHQPAFFQAQANETITQKKGFPSIVEADVELYLYAKDGTDATVADYSAATVLNTAVQAVVNALQPAVCSDSQTLGGLVSHCYPVNVQYVEGLIGDQGVAVVKLNLLWTE